MRGFFSKIVYAFVLLCIVLVTFYISGCRESSVEPPDATPAKPSMGGQDTVIETGEQLDEKKK